MVFCFRIDNKTILVGYTGSDPEIQYLQSGRCMAKISVATSSTWVDKNTKEKQTQTEKALQRSFTHLWNGTAPASLCFSKLQACLRPGHRR